MKHSYPQTFSWESLGSRAMKGGTKGRPPGHFISKCNGNNEAGVAGSPLPPPLGVLGADEFRKKTSC